MSLSSVLSCGLSGGLSGLSRGGGVRGAWSPADLPGVTQLWLPGPTHSYTDTARTTLAGDTDAVAATVDRLQGTVWSEADPLKRLTLRDLGGGQWVWRSDGINDGLGHGPATTGARAIAMAYTQTTNLPGAIRVLQSGTAVSVVSPRRGSGSSLTASSATIRNPAFANDANPHVVVLSRSSAGPWRAWSDGASLSVSDVTNNFGSLGIGAFTGATSSDTFTGDIYAVVDFDPDDDGYLSDSDRAALTTYLASLYGGVL